MSNSGHDSNMGEEKFDSLLAWLDPSQERAGVKYEEIRQGLVRIFVCRGCANPEDLADETIDRVAQRMEELTNNYVGEPARYLYGIAMRVYQEEFRRQLNPVMSAKEISSALISESEHNERLRSCMKECIEALPVQNRDLILQYYQEEKRAKIEALKHLATTFGLPINAMRIRIYRIRQMLNECATRCAEKE
jgi:DNA-directed RNA polymerase specialized sigma24 family protein